jgi:hypothetical protein
MPHEPAFMARLEPFREELAKVDSLPAWARFKARWFDDQPWPRRTPEELEHLRALPPVVSGGRTFQRGPLADDVTPEARYEYLAAMGKAFAVLFPPDPGAGTRFHCPACELFTDEPGDPACPSCGRPLLTMRLAPPR